METNDAEGSRSKRLLLLLVGVLVAVAYSQVLLSHARGRWVAPLRDDLIFLQYARSMADGHPYRYFYNAEKTTGATSHLYVWVIAQLARVGLGDDGLIAGVFFLNGLFWLISLMLVYAIARKEFEGVAFPAAVLVALTGPIHFGFFACHDMGLATMLFLLALWGLVVERWAAAALGLFLLSWARPEGLVVSLALVIVALAAPRGRRRPAWVAAGAVGVLGAVGVAALNFGLTGEFAFTSMKGKGLVGHYPFHVVLTELAGSLAAIVREVFVGWSDGARALYFVPLAGVPILLGVAPRCRRAGVHAWVLASAGLVILMVSSSGYAGLQHDKYFLWIFIPATLYAVAGLPALEEILRGRIRWTVLYALCVAYALAGSAWFLGDYGKRVLVERAMVGTCEQVRGQTSIVRIGVVAGSGIQYYFPDCEVINISGVTHRDFGAAWGDPAAQFETLEDNRQLWPSIWFLSDAERSALEAMGIVGEPLLSTPAFQGAESHETFYAARWDEVARPVQPRSDAAAALQRAGYVQLIDRIDLGSPRQEAAHRYRRFTRPAGTRLLGSVARHEVEGAEPGLVADAGYAVFGDEEFDINVRTGRDLLVAARITRSIQAVSLLAPRRRETFEFSLSPPVQVRVFANGVPVDLRPVVGTPDDGTTVTARPGDLAAQSEDRFEDKVLVIPAKYVTTDPLRLRIAGDHIAYHYWFYQQP